VLDHLGFIDGAPGSSGPVTICRETRWVRASRSGMFRPEIGLGAEVAQRQVLGHLSDIYGRRNLVVRSPFDGIVIGVAKKPLANQGDALVHVARGPEGEATPD
jgi:predicted deacylase